MLKTDEICILYFHCFNFYSNANLKKNEISHGGFILSSIYSRADG